jgi:hypothetical protein
VKLHVDLDTLQFIEGPGFRSTVTSIRLKRGDAATLEVRWNGEDDLPHPRKVLWWEPAEPSSEAVPRFLRALPDSDILDSLIDALPDRGGLGSGGVTDALHLLGTDDWIALAAKNWGQP